ncbi:MAG TPA: hypothetical protein VF952_18795 [Chloroflexia bacterium]|jgi:hypothetical protein
MISLLPAENAVWAEKVTQEAQRASQDNFARLVQIGDTQLPTYHNIYVIPEEKYPISERNIRLDTLRSLLSEKWPEARKVESGYSSHTEELAGAFAFGAAHGGGAFYGSHKDGKVTSLHIIRPSSNEPEALQPFEAALARLGEQYNLILADWWTATVVDLRDPESIRGYAVGES